MSNKANNLNMRFSKFQLEHSGDYFCEAVGFPPSTPGAQIGVTLQVERRK